MYKDLTERLNSLYVLTSSTKALQGIVLVLLRSFEQGKIRYIFQIHWSIFNPFSRLWNPEGLSLGSKRRLWSLSKDRFSSIKNAKKCIVVDSILALLVDFLNSQHEQMLLQVFNGVFFKIVLSHVFPSVFLDN